MAERRNERRRRVLQGVKISFSDDFCCSEGVLKNVSEGGAQVLLNDGVAVPDRFKIINEMEGYEVECTATWRKGQTIGVKFTGPKHQIKGKSRQITAYSGM